VIAVGQQVNRTFTGLALYFEVVAPRNGFLVSNLTWDRTENGTTLLLSLNDAQFQPPNAGRVPAHVIGRLQVAAGEDNQNCRACWWHGRYLRRSVRARHYARVIPRRLRLL
jgi:hypothetical protein